MNCTRRMATQPGKHGVNILVQIRKKGHSTGMILNPQRKHGAWRLPYAEAKATADCLQARASVTPHVKPIPADANSNNCPGRMSPSRRICT